MDIKNMQEYEQIYERAKKNSIGENKKCEEKRLKKKVAINFSAAILTITLAFAAVAGCSIIKSINNTEPFSYSEPYDFIGYDYGYGFHDIHDFLTAKLDKLMRNNKMYDYYVNDNYDRVYNYTSDDYRNMNGLDESYLICFYDIADETTLNEVLKAFGYDDLKSYLSEKGYTGYSNEECATWWKFDTYNQIVLDWAKEKGVKAK